MVPSHTDYQILIPKAKKEATALVRRKPPCRVLRELRTVCSVHYMCLCMSVAKIMTGEQRNNPARILKAEGDGGSLNSLRFGRNGTL